jgi:hypothetical protein
MRYIDLINLSTLSCDHKVVFKLKLKYKQTKYEENITETSSENVLRSITIMLLFAGLFGI